MSSGYEPALHALSIEPPVARPGDTVRLTFRTRNVGTRSSPTGTVDFALPAGLDALGETEVPLPSVEPGEPATATICARVMPPFDERAELAIQAFLVLHEARLATNVCLLRVRSRAVLDGGSSGTFVEPIDAGTVRVRAVVCNEGDGPATTVRVRLPPPGGCRRLDGDGAATIDVERLDAGDSVTLGFDARLEHAMTEVRADGGEVRFGAGTRRGLPARSAVAVQPAIVPPLLAVRPLRRRVAVTVELRNDGWAHAHDACVRIALPAGLRLAEATVEVDGVPVAGARARRGTALGRLQRQAGMHALVVSLLPARSTTRLTFTAHHAGDYDGGTLGIGIEAHATELDYRAEHYRELRIEPIDVPARVAPGETVTIRARVVNAGDRAERFGVALVRAGLVEALPLERTLEAGACAVVDLPLSIGTAAGDGSRLPFAALVLDENGERARADLAVTVREPVVPATEPDDADTDAERAVPALHAALRAPDEVVAGAPLAMRLDVDVEDAIERLAIRAPQLRSARYIAGSTSVGGCAILDEAVGSPLHGDGLVLRGVPRATRVTIGWSLLIGTAPDESLALAVDLDADGHHYALAPLAVRVRAADAFATRPAELRYHVDACALSPRTDAPEPVAACREVPYVDEPVAAPAPATRVRTPRWDEIARLLRGVRCGGLVAHVLVLRAFFPEPDRAETGMPSALDAVGHALRDAFDRLFVKLRIPGFTVAADDLEDRGLRHALLALLEAEGTSVCCAVLADAPLGAPVALRALLAAIPPPAGDTALGTAANAYLRLLDRALAEHEALPLELFDDAVARGRDAALDDARAALLMLVDEQVTHDSVAC
jgi:hypothetical protein